MTSLTTYAAPCVRACAMRSGLLNRDEWRTLFAVESAGAALAWLDRREIFGGEVHDVLMAERAAHDNVIRDASALLRFARSGPRELLRFFVHYYDVLNVECVVHRILSLPAMPQSKHSLYDTGHVGLLRRSDLSSVTNCAALSRLLKHTVLSAPFDDALLRYADDEDVTRLVEAVDMAFFSAWVAAAENCGFRVRTGTDGTGMAVFIVARIIEAVVRIRVHRQGESNRAVKWLSLVASGRQIEECLTVLNSENAEVAIRGLADLLLPASARGTTTPDGAASPSTSFLQRLILDHAVKATRGVKFDADFLASFLILQMCQAREITVLLESKDSKLSAVGCSLYAEGAA